MPAGKPASCETLGEHVRAERRVLRGLPDDGAAGREPVDDRDPGDVDGEVPRRTAATTPIGSCTTRMRFASARSWVEGSTLPAWRSMSSEARRKWSAVYSSISSRDSRIVLPTSRGDHLRDLLVPLHADREGLAAELDAVDHRRLAPRLERLAPRPHGRVDLGERGADDGAEHARRSRGCVTSISSPSPATHSPPMNAPFRVVTAIAHSSALDSVERTRCLHTPSPS